MSVALGRQSAKRKLRSRPIIAMLVLLSLTLVIIDQAGDSAPTHPIRSGVRDASASVTNSLSRLWPFHDTATVKRLKEKNAALQKQLDTAQGQAAQASDAVHQRDVLTGLLNLPSPNNVARVIAPVTAIGASNYDSTIELGKGSNDGVAAGMPVVNDKGLIGRVVQTSSTRSTVLLAIDTTSNISVRLPTGDIGVAVGGGTNKAMRIDLIDLNSQIKAGDVAVTSGEDHSIFPPGLVVGTIQSVTAGPQDLRKDVVLTPAVNINQLDDVAVLKWRP